MKIKFIIIIYTFFGVSYLSGQTYNIATYNNQFAMTCSGNFYDSGGSGGGYTAGQSYTMTFCPSTSGAYINLNFSQWAVNFGDALQIFDGPSVTSPLFGIFTNTLSPIGIIVGASVVNTTGCITVKWTSTSAGQGWAAAVSCGMPCQPFTTNLFTSIPPFTIDSGIYYIDICPHDTVIFTAKNNYTSNNLFYHQSDSTSTFHWNLGNGTSGNGQTITTVYDSIQGYIIHLNSWDSVGCMASNYPNIRVRVSTKPNFNGTHPLITNICQYDTNQIIGQFTTKPWAASSSLGVAGTTYLPDGSGASYTSTLVFNSFASGQTLTNVSNIIGICANMEHSYLGDLNITIKCPNNSTVTLKSYPGGTNTFLGEPIDIGATAQAGLGYDYCWKPTATTTMLAAAGVYSHSFTDNAGNFYSGASFLPPSTTYPATSTASTPYPILSYAPQSSFSTLVGCPLNGAWTITVTDNLLIDNGYIFSWGINFDPSILPVTWGFEPTITSQIWNPNTNVITNSAGNVTVLSPDTGLYTYVYTIVDNHGCSYDTSVTVDIVPQPIVNLGNDTILCGQPTLVLDADGGTLGASYLWNLPSGLTTQTNTINSPGTWNHNYNVKVTNTNGVIQCIDRDTINIQQFPIPQVNLGNDTLFCEGDSLLLAAGTNTGTTYNWYNGSNDSTIYVSSSNNAWVNISNGHCENSDTVLITVASFPIISFGNDTLICDGNSLLLDATNVGSVYLWQDNSTNAQYNVISSGNYCVAANNLGCISYDSIEVTYGSKPIIFLDDVQEFCVGDSLKLSPGNGSKFLWTSGSTQNSIWVHPSTPTSYGVIVWDSAGCNDSVWALINPVSNPIPVMVSDFDTICLGKTVTLTASGGDNYLWNNGSNNSILSLRPESSTKYTVKVTNTLNGLECSASTSLKIFTKDCNKLYLPNAFTPNGDGLNDDFGPVGEFNLESYEINIFDRWGKLVFNSTDVLKHWNGKDLDGDVLPSGVFAYVVRLKKPFIKTFELSGTVHLLK